ncbi:MAG: chemotaxis protein CheA [Pseudomonadota bacterium]|nr:chemotaxis protein CheA [Pseudomonadota bacterium]
MNEFIEQFILESRELVEQASVALSALEQAPQDAERIDATFRAVHTLKGGAAIVDFFPMERAVHAAEDALSAVRSGQRALTAALVGDCFACLDQVSRWLDSMEQSGELPVGADAQADEFVARMAATADQRGVAPVTKRTDYSWLDDLSRRNASLRSQARTAVRFAPHAASFFQGEDPLALLASMPGLLSMELATVQQPAALDELDPFQCMLIVTALSAASADEVSAHFQGQAGECDVRTLDAEASGSAGALTEHARKLLEAQIRLLDVPQSTTFAGRVAAAGAVAANVLRFCRRVADADLIARASERSLSENNVQHLQEAIAKVLVPAAAPMPPLATDVPEQAQPEVSARSLRVDAERVDALVRLTGELTVVKNAIGHVLRLAEAEAGSHANTIAGALSGPHRNLDHLIGELQSAVLSIRVVPLRAVLQRFPRLVREISTGLDKPVRLLIEGDDTEADKAIVEMLFEPLLHILRNAMDHGIESANVRHARNKPAVATLRIRAARQGGHVLVEVEDDGGGVDVERVRAVAKQRGVASAEVLDAMSDEQIIDLVFAAGFSTASRVTGLSGRGVGMDAVRNAVERVGGRVSIDSRAGLGASVKLLLPFSVMLTHVMTVEAGGQLFGIPFDAVVETLSVPTEHISGVGAAMAMVRRNRTLPLFELASLLEAQTPPRGGREALIVVATIAGHLGGLLVDRLGERMEVMLKPLDGLLAGLPGIAGTTILGDGRVLLVLDLPEVLR